MKCSTARRETEDWRQLGKDADEMRRRCPRCAGDAHVAATPSLLKGLRGRSSVAGFQNFVPLGWCSPRS